MKEILPEPVPIVRNASARIRELFSKNVIPTYARFELAWSHGAGTYLWDVNGKRYVDMGGGIAVCALGHANAEITQALATQASKLVHVSNFYYHEPQGRLAEALVSLIGPGKCFFCNSGAEANEGLFKVARRFGDAEGRFEIITATNSFHGRTLAGIAATGQEKVKKGFGPATPGFIHVPFNNLEAVHSAISPATVAVLIESIQGESGITPADADYLFGLRQLCNEKKLLLLMDEVQAGYFRTGRFCGYQRLLEKSPGGEKFLPDGVSMAKSLGGGFPIGAFWVRDKFADLLGPGSHASTYGGTPLGCAVALKVLEVVQREKLDQNARLLGEKFRQDLEGLISEFPTLLKTARGYGLMIGLELRAEHPCFAKNEKSAAAQFVNALHENGLLAIPAGLEVIRFLPPLNLRPQEADEALGILRRTLTGLKEHVC